MVKDAGTIAGCLLLAMEEIVFRFIGERNSQKAAEFMLYFTEKENNQYSYQNCWVAEAGGEVIAAANLYDGAALKKLRQPVMDYIKTRFKRDVEPEDETEAGEYYLDSLGVRPDQQGKGTGAKLLRFLVDEYVLKNRQTLGLLVDEDNPGAKRLYLKMGFTCVGHKVLLGKRMEHLQVNANLFHTIAETTV